MKSVYAIGLCALLLPALPSGAQTAESGLTVEAVATGLSSPVAMEFYGPDRFFVLEKNTGRVRAVTFGSNSAPVVLDLAVSNNSERGLLGIAVDPNFATNGFVYLYYSRANSDGGAWLDNRVVRVRWNGSALVEQTQAYWLVASDPNQSNGPNHDGGIMRIGPDGKLYFVTGDLNRNRIEQNNGTLSAGSGGVHRLNLDGTIPADNPWATDSRPEVRSLWAYGVRNSYGMTFDTQTGRLWDTENGPDIWDEVNLVEKGFNSGWRDIMGPDAQDPQNVTDLVMLPGAFYSDPEFNFFNPIGITAIEFLNSNRYSAVIRGHAIVGDSNNGRLYRLPMNANRTGFSLTGALADLIADTSTERNSLTFAQGLIAPTDMRLGPDGLLYVVAAGGTVHRIRPTNPPAVITGTVNLADLSGSPEGVPLTLTLLSNGQPIETLTTTLNAAGQYTVTTPTYGSWRLRAKAGSWLSVDVGNRTLLPNNTVNITFPANGDTDNDNTVDDADLTNIILDFGAAGGSTSGYFTDFNRDGVVDDADLTILILNFGSTGS